MDATPSLPAVPAPPAPTSPVDSPALGRPATRVAAWLNPDPWRLLRAVSVGLLVLWCAWWAGNFAQGKLIGCYRTWFGVAPSFGGDFWVGCYHPSVNWLNGKDPYADEEIFFTYPPMLMRVFAWCGWFDLRQATYIFMTALGLMAAAGGWAAWRTRRRLGLSEIPLSTVLVAVLYSFPVVFAMERGNCDLIIVPLIIAAVALMRHRSVAAQLAAGAILSIAPWLKVYPGLLGVGLVGLRRWHALTGFVLAGLLFGVVNFQEVQKFRRNCARFIGMGVALSEAHPHGSPAAWSHSLTENWPRLWRNTPPPLRWLGKIPGMVAGGAILGSMLAWTSYHVFRSRRRLELAYAYLMWVTALATFVPVSANDYSLFFLPMAALAVWDRRDPLLVQVAMALLAVWWQPMGLPIVGSVLIVVKVCGLAMVGVCLAERAAAESAGAVGGASQGHAPQVPALRAA